MTEGAIAQVTGRGLPLPGNDIDTDQIIESRYLRMTTFRGMEAYVFESLRRSALATGGPPHPFDDDRFAGASILLVGRNFGCGSSREHAPQGLRRFGIRAIVGESFGEIFAGNCLALGLPCIAVSASESAWLQALCTAAPDSALRIDILAGKIFAGTRRLPIALPEGRRQRLLDGSWNSLNVLLAGRELVEAKLAALPPIRLASPKPVPSH